MKRTCILFLLLNLFFWTHAQSPAKIQIAFYDAQKLEAQAGTPITYADDGSITLGADSSAAILHMYTSLGNNASKEQLIEAYKPNPFIKYNTGNHAARLAFTFNAKTFLSGGSFSLGGLDVTNIANGIAQFMVKRAKEELTISFFQHFQTFVNQHVEIKVLFPNTVDALGNLLSYQYPNMINNLRTAFMNDLSSLVSNLPIVLSLPKYQAFFTRFPEVRIAVNTLELVQKISRNNLGPADAIHDFADSVSFATTASPDLANFSNAVKLGDIFSQSVRDSSATGKGWISVSEFAAKAKDPGFIQIFLGLIYQQVVRENIQFDTHPFAPILAGVNGPKGPLALVRAEMTQFLQLTQQVDTVIESLAKKQNTHENLTGDDYYNLINTTINVIDFSFDVARFFNAGSDDVHSYTKLAREGNTIYQNIYKKDYPQAVTNALNFLSDLFDLINKNKASDNAIINDLKGILNTANNTVIKSGSLSSLSKSEWKAIDNAVNTPAQSDQNITVLRSAQQYKDFAKFNKVMAKVKTYGLFMANMLSAQSADDVENIVENAALPVGSSSIKKYSVFNIAVQSYLGASFRIDNPSASFSSPWTDRLGVTGPIGLGFNFGLRKAGSVGLLVNLFDLGAIIDYQLKIDTTVNSSNAAPTPTINKNYQVKLGQIVSPGFYAVYGFLANLPLAVGIGGQYGPGLGKINSGGTAVVTNPSWRFNAFLAVDIPFFNILNIKRK